MYTMYMYRAEAMAVCPSMPSSPWVDLAWLCRRPSKAHAGAAQRSTSQATIVPAAHQPLSIPTLRCVDDRTACTDSPYLQAKAQKPRPLLPVQEPISSAAQAWLPKPLQPHDQTWTRHLKLCCQRKQQQPCTKLTRCYRGCLCSHAALCLVMNTGTGQFSQHGQCYAKERHGLYLGLHSDMRTCRARTWVRSLLPT